MKTDFNKKAPNMDESLEAIDKTWNNLEDTPTAFDEKKVKKIKNFIK